MKKERSPNGKPFGELLWSYHDLLFSARFAGVLSVIA